MEFTDVISQIKKSSRPSLTSFWWQGGQTNLPRNPWGLSKSIHKVSKELQELYPMVSGLFLFQDLSAPSLTGGLGTVDHFLGHSSRFSSMEYIQDRVYVNPVPDFPTLWAYNCHGKKLSTKLTLFVPHEIVYYLYQLLSVFCTYKFFQFIILRLQMVSFQLLYFFQSVDMKWGRSDKDNLYNYQPYMALQSKVLILQ